MTDASGAVKVELFGMNADGKGMSYTVADGTAIPPGTVMKLSGNRTMIASTGQSDIVAGIISFEKEADDASTEATVWQDGVFEMVASGAIGLGELVKSAGFNHVMQGARAETSVALAASFATIIGHALKSVADDAKVQIRVNI